MVTELLLVSLASLWALETLRGLLPFAIPPRLAPLVVLGLAYGSVFLYSHHAALPLVLASAGAGGVAILRRLAGGTSVPPWPWHDTRQAIHPDRRSAPGRRARVYPQSMIGKRVPTLTTDRTPR